MNDNSKKWVAALRSGKYKQTKGFLHAQGGYCCLGVACEISGLDEWEPDDACWYLDNKTMLPDEVRAWLGFADYDGVGILEKGQTLAKMNDDGKTFTEIADAIEANADILFIKSLPYTNGPSSLGGLI